MWISLSRQQSTRSSQMPAAAHSSIPPPGPPGRPGVLKFHPTTATTTERRKGDDKKRKDKEKHHDHESCSSSKETESAQPSAPQLPEEEEEINENYELPSVMGAKTAWGSPPGHQFPAQITNESGGGEGGGGSWNRSGPIRKSFRFAGHIRDLSTERNMLPLWLEEETREGIRQSEHNFINKNETTVIHDNSFESRWNSMKGINKKRPPILSVRPPGWEDVDQPEKRKKKNACKTKSNFCPSFTINDLPKDNLQQDASFTGIQPISPPVTVNIVPPTERNHLCQSNAFNMADLTANVDNIFSDSFLKGQHYSNSTSHLHPQSATTSPTRTLSNTSTSTIIDRHLWASTDSFICEDFSFCSGRQPTDTQQEHIPPQTPRSYSQIILNHPESDRQEFTDQLRNDFSCISTPEQEDFEPKIISLISPHFPNITENETAMTAPDNNKDAVNDSLDITDTLDNTLSHESINCLVPSNSTIRVTDNIPHENWIRFDNGSFEHLDKLAIDTFNNSIDGSSHPDGLEHQSNFKNNQNTSLESFTSPTSPISPRNYNGSTLNLMEPRLEQTSGSYKGQLVRTYSLRSRRASKRVTKTVNRKTNPSEYGKLTEPVPPMFSKAALTMISGPGLFQQDNPPADRMADMDDQTEQSRKGITNVEASTSTATQSKLTIGESSSISHGLPKRVGSLRFPRLPTIFLRRSVSLNTPKISRGEVPFQRLPERRGSFRRAISGLGAIAQNFRRRSGTFQTSKSSSSHIVEKASDSRPPRLHRAGSIGSSLTPKAPRLPRRTISHKQAIANDT